MNNSNAVPICPVCMPVVGMGVPIYSKYCKAHKPATHDEIERHFVGHYHRHFDEAALREQIAREIKAECEQGGAMACGISGNYQCSCSGAAAIARGEK